MSSPIAIRRQIAKIMVQIAAYDRLAADNANLVKQVEAISSWSLSRQVEHVMATNGRILDVIEELLDGRTNSGQKPMLKGHIALRIGRIPRGRGKAPKATRPEDRAPEALRALIAEVRNRFDALTANAAAIDTCRATAPHPFFGPFTPAMWLRFIEIHNQHHQAIIADIEAAS